MERLSSLFKRIPRGPAVLAALGLAARLAHVLLTRADPPHPDLGSFLAPALSLAHPFDTSPREPLFVWWLWVLYKTGLAFPLGVRLMTALWFVPALWLFHPLARRFLGLRGAWVAAGLFAFLPAQIVSDGVGLRHSLETVGVLLLLTAAFAPEPRQRRSFVQAAAAAAGLMLARINYLGSALLVLAAHALRTRLPRFLLAALPALFLLFFHFQNNRARHGDAFYSVNLHTYWFSNLEYIGHPGFPASFEEWQKDAHRPSLTFRQWAFERHTPAEFLKECAIGYVRCLWIFFERVYFSVGLPAGVKWGLLGLYAAGILLSLARPSQRPLFLFLSFLVLPYAFVSHVFWAGRFFAPVSPLALIFAVAGAQSAERFLLRHGKARFPGFRLFQGPPVLSDRPPQLPR